MSAVKDARVATTMPSHPKTKKLMRRLGPEGCWYLIRLFLWATENSSDGDLEGMSDDDIELAIDWPGEPLCLVGALVAVGYLEGGSGARRIHDWADHNPWAAGADKRTAKARWNAVKRHHGEREADRQVPEYRTNTPATSSADSKEVAVHEPENSSPPSPSPYPYPKEELTSPPQDKAGNEQIPYQAIVDAYNGTMTGLPKVRELTEERKKLIRRAWNASSTRRTMNFWTSYFEECQDDNYYNGSGPYQPPYENWRPDFNHLLSNKVVTKVYERAMDRLERTECSA